MNDDSEKEKEERRKARAAAIERARRGFAAQQRAWRTLPKAPAAKPGPKASAKAQANPPVHEDPLDLVRAARALVKDRAAHEPITIEKYRRAYRRMQRRPWGALPDPWGAASTYYQERAAGRWGREEDALAALKAWDEAQRKGDPEHRAAALASLKAARDALVDYESRYPKGSHGIPPRPARGARTERENERERARKEGRGPVVKAVARTRSKRRIQVPDSFESDLMARATAFGSRYAAAAAAGMTAGFRPEELRRGIVLSLGTSPEGWPGLRLVARNAKPQRGQPRDTERAIWRPAEQDAATRFLAQLAAGGVKEIRVGDKREYSRAVMRFARAALGPELGGKVSGYSLRHIFVADLKNEAAKEIAGAPAGERDALDAKWADLIARACGHSSEKSQSAYGFSGNGRGGRRIAVVSNREVTRRREPHRTLEALRARTRQVRRERGRGLER